MTSLEVIEHQRIKIGKKFNSDLKQITYEDAEYLRQIEITQKRQTFRWGKNFVSPQQWVGIISIPSGSIEILPKIAENDNIPYLRGMLVYMLQIVHNVPVRKNINATLEYGTQGFLDILILLFLQELEKQTRQGLFKTYQKHFKNLNVIKGTVDYPKNLKKNALLKNKFFCKYSKFTEDNILNQIIKFTLVYLLKITLSQRNKSFIKRLLISFDEVSLKPIKETDLDSIIFHRNNLRFEKIINFCRLFIKELALDFKSGDAGVEFMLFDMNQLFEKFIYEMFKKVLKKDKVIYQYNKTHVLTTKVPVSNKVQLKPDLVIIYNGKKIILDTKWKTVKKFADEKDIYQMNAYLDCIPNLEEGILLYPKSTRNDKMVNDYIINDTKVTKTLKIRTIDLSSLGENPDFSDCLISILK